MIYNGPVSAEDCPEAAAAIATSAGLKVRFISNVGELPNLLNNAAVFIIGGTEDDLHPLLKAFTPKVTETLKGYLHNGGRYLGLCGGGFAASTGWNEGNARVKGLGLIPAATKVYRGDFAARIIPVNWQGNLRFMYFKAGPSFQLINHPENVKVIANYEDGSIAALMSSYGKGKLAVCGPHPEARPSWKDEASDGYKWTSSTDLAIDLLKDLLSERPNKH
ncbi:MAG: BPL-N domain-containing protein [Deltaproteobacteria bacterium]|nr:BPL-N domain-containing protein [Deltaproteobacteria bacterium]